VEGTGFEPSVPRRARNRSHIELASSHQPEDVERRAGDRREAAAILIAAGDPMISRAASAASARSGVVRAMRPRITRHSSSAIALIASITAAEGACWSSRSSIGRTSFRPMLLLAVACTLLEQQTLFDPSYEVRDAAGA